MSKPSGKSQASLSPLAKDGTLITADKGGGQRRLRHVAIIMDGNGRWAKARGLSREQGHKAGVEAARETMRVAKDLGLSHLTLYSFSTENWQRPDWEVSYLMQLMKGFIEKDLQKLVQENIRVRVIGDRQNLSADLRQMIERAEYETRENDAYVLQIAFNYGARDEIVRAARQLAEQVAAGVLKPEQISEGTLASVLDTSDAPDPDLVIRTSGEMRISNFLLWQSAYSEFVFLQQYWPDFDDRAFRGAVETYFERERRFGGRDRG